MNKLAEAAFITTPDQLHTQPALQALNLGYHVLLEKPMATKLEECILLVKKAKEVDRQLRIAHVLRYTPFFSAVHEIVRSGKVRRAKLYYLRGESGKKAKVREKIGLKPLKEEVKIEKEEKIPEEPKVEIKKEEGKIPEEK